MPVTIAWITVAAYLLAVNVATAAAFAWDKLCAQRGWWRMPERSLLSLAAAGGSPGAFTAGHYLRHKTYKEPFRTRLRVIAAGQVVLIVFAGLAWLLVGR